MKLEIRRETYYKDHLYQCINTLVFCVVLIIFFIFPQTVHAQVNINEFLPDSTTEWIEFYNASSSADYIKSYYIDDDLDFLSDSGSSAKKLLTSLNTSNPTFPYFETSSFLNNSGDYVVLFNSAGIIIDQYQYNSNPGRDITIGRYPDGTGAFYFLVYSTKADSNPAPPTPTASPTNPPTPQPTNAPTPSPTPTPKPTPTKTPTSKSTSTPTFEPKVLETIEPLSYPTISPTGMVAGATDEKRSPVVAIIFIISGIAFLGYGGYLLYNQRHGKDSKIS